MSGRLRYWREITRAALAEDGDVERRIALLPVGAVEQHGPHLPLGTDTMIAEALVAGLDGRLADGLDILVLPTQSVGDSLEHCDYPGTLTQRAELLIESWTALGAACAAAGIRKIAILNSHGGQPQVVDIVAQRLRAEHGMLAARLNSFRFGTPKGLFDADELAHGYHAGEVETSLMLAIAPDLVAMDRAADFDTLAAQLAGQNRVLHAEGRAGFAWQAQDLNPAGAMGNAAAADGARGARLLDHMTGCLADALAEMAAFPLDRLKRSP